MGTTVFERQRPSAATVDHALSGTARGVFWLEDAPGDAYPSLTSSTSADLVVVGGGYSGLWTALLAKRREIDALIAAKGQGRTIVPLEMLTQGRYIKLRISVGKGKKQWDKRQTLKARDEQREVTRAMKASR